MRDRLELTNYQASWPNARVGSESHFARKEFVPRPIFWLNDAESSVGERQAARRIHALGYAVESGV